MMKIQDKTIKIIIKDNMAIKEIILNMEMIIIEISKVDNKMITMIIKTIADSLTRSTEINKTRMEQIINLQYISKKDRLLLKNVICNLNAELLYSVTQDLKANF